MLSKRKNSADKVAIELMNNFDDFDERDKMYLQHISRYAFDWKYRVELIRQKPLISMDRKLIRSYRFRFFLGML